MLCRCVVNGFTVYNVLGLSDGCVFFVALLTVNCSMYAPFLLGLSDGYVCYVTVLAVDCCVHRTCWCFTTKGLCLVGQDEIVFLLEVLPDEKTIPTDIFHHINQLYELAGNGN